MPIQRLNYLQGINLGTSPGTLPPNQLLTMDNVRFNGENAVWNGSSCRLGGISSTSIGSGIYFVQTDTSAEYFVVNDVTNSKIQQAVSAGGGSMNFTDITGGATIDNKGSFEILNGNIFYAGGPNGIFYWNGSGNIVAVGGSSPTSADMLKVANNFLFAAYDLDPLGTVYWSNVADGTTWVASNTLTFRQNDGDFIRALSSLGQDLIIFKGKSIGRLSTQTTILAGSVILGPLSTVVEGIGCSGRNAVDHLPDGRLVFFGSDSHVYIFDGSIPTDISDQPFPYSNIQADLNNLVSLISPSLVYVRTYAPRHEVWVGSAGGAGPVHVYNYIYNSWYTKSGTVPTTYFTGLSTGRKFRQVYGLSTAVFNTQNVLISGDSSGFVYLEDCSFGSNPQVSSPTTTMEFSIPAPGDDRENFQRFFVLPFQTASAGQTITYYTGRDTVYGSSTTFTSTGGWDRLKISIPSSTITTSFQVKVQYSSTSTKITFDPAYISDESVQ